MYYVGDDGTRVTNNIFSVGSGSTYAYGVLDSEYKWELNDTDAYELARRAIYHATYRDAMSGGMVRIYHMKSTGWVKISEEDVTELHYKYKQQQQN